MSPVSSRLRRTQLVDDLPPRSYADYFVKESVQGYFGLNNAMPTHEQVADGCKCFPL